MQKKTVDDSPKVEMSDLPRCGNSSISEWLTELEQALEAEDDDVRREYTNIGGQNGLELFV